MKKILFGFIAFVFLAFASIAPEKGAGIWYFSGVPDATPETTLGSEMALNYSDRSLWVWNRTGAAWQYLNGIQYAAGVPSGAPTYGNMGYFNTDTGLFYNWDGAAWQLLGGVSIDPTSSPTLTEVDGVLKLDFSNSTDSDANNIASALVSSAIAKNTLQDSLLFAVSDSVTTLTVKGVLNFINSGGAISQTLTGDSSTAILTTNFRGYGIDDLQIDSLVQRIIETPEAKERLNTNVSSKPIIATITNSSGQNAQIKYIGKVPTFDGNNGSFTLSFDRDSTDLQSWWFGGGSGENVWNGSGDLQIDVTVSGGDINTNSIDEYFANVQLTNSGNNEVLSDPKGQLSVSIFQERTATGTVQIRASNLQGFGSDGFKLTATY